MDLPPERVPVEILAALQDSHGFKGTEICPCRPGEAAALAQLTFWMAVARLRTGSEFPAPWDVVSSAALSGTSAPARPGVRRQNENPRREQLQAIAVWEQELGWREFTSGPCLPQLADGPYREQWRRFLGEQQDWFDWKEGQTGMPIIDAAMRQLSQTGWMHNRLPHDRAFIWSKT